jgi:hypothetical protein
MYWGRLNPSGEIVHPKMSLMTPSSRRNGDAYDLKLLWKCAAKADSTGFVGRPAKPQRYSP